jgi:hypothetical protein
MGTFGLAFDDEHIFQRVPPSTSTAAPPREPIGKMQSERRSGRINVRVSRSSVVEELSLIARCHVLETY